MLLGALMALPAVFAPSRLGGANFSMLSIAWRGAPSKNSAPACAGGENGDDAVPFEHHTVPGGQAHAWRAEICGQLDHRAR